MSLNKNPNIKSFYKDVYFSHDKQYSSADDHINSFNKFIKTDMQKIISDYNPIEVRYEDVKNGVPIKIIAKTTIKDPVVVPPHCVGPDKKKSKVYPTAICLSDKTYNIHVYAHSVFELYIKIGNGPSKLVKKVDSKNIKNGAIILAKIPTMVMSDYCSLSGTDENTRELLGEDRYELGGYFIIKGKEYYILTQENKTSNFIYKNIDYRSNGDPEYKTWIQSKKTNKYDYPYYTFVKLTKGTIKKDGTKKELISIAVTISKKKDVYIPLKIFYKAIGVITDKEIHELIIHEPGKNKTINQNMEDILTSSLEYYPSDGTYIKTQDQAILYIANKYASKYYRGFEYKNKSENELLEYFKYELLIKLFLPHLGGIENVKKKSIFLGNMIKKAINMRLKIEDEIDKDNYGNKRLLTAGPLYGYLVKYYYNMSVGEFKIKMKKELEYYSPDKTYLNIISRIWDESKMNKIATNISKGEWPVGTSKRYTTKKGMTSFREMKSRSDTIASLERIITPLAADTKGQMFNVHMVQQTNWGVICTPNTPDGGNIGIVKHKCYLLYISLYEDPSIYYSILNKDKDVIKAEDIIPKDIEKTTAIFINGSLDFFIHKNNTKKIHKKLIELRRKGRGRMNSIVCDYEKWEIYIYTDAGRCLRPLYIVDNIIDKKTGLVTNKLRITSSKAKKMSWEELIIDGCIEYISIHESQYNSYIALSDKELNNERLNRYTHCEIDSTSILSLNSLGIKWIERMQAPRAVYQNTMQKQTIGLPCTNYMYRSDNSLNILCYPEKPLINTIADKFMHRDKLPAGNMLLIAIMSYSGYNQEDSIILNKATVDNGFLDVITYKTIVEKLETNNEKFMKPKEAYTENYKKYNSYDAIGENGLPIIGKPIKKGDVIIGKVKLFTKTEKESFRQKSRAFDYKDASATYKELVPGVIESVYKIQNDDGVTIVKVKVRLYRKVIIGDKCASTAAQKGTVSIIWSKEKMPRTADGRTPDIIFNPHSIITRMTINHIMFIAAGNIASNRACFIDGTGFNEVDIKKDILSQPENKNFGEEEMYDGITGLKIKTKIYLGYIYYQRLKQMVDDKMFARPEGPVVRKTRQPIRGRKKGGGLKMGSMEKDAIIAHGCSLELLEMIWNKSDKFELYISENTGYPTIGNKHINLYGNEDNYKNIAKIRITWCSKMLFDLFATCGIGTKFELEEDEY